MQDQNGKGQSGEKGEESKSTQQKRRDEISGKRRKNKLGEDVFDALTAQIINIFGANYNYKNVMKIALMAASKFNLKIDRQGKRRFEWLLLWIFERWEIIGCDFIINAIHFVQQSAVVQDQKREATAPETKTDEHVKQEENDGNSLFDSSDIEDVEFSISDDEQM